MTLIPGLDVAWTATVAPTPPLKKGPAPKAQRALRRMPHWAMPWAPPPPPYSPTRDGYLVSAGLGADIGEPMMLLLMQLQIGGTTDSVVLWWTDTTGKKTRPGALPWRGVAGFVAEYVSATQCLIEAAKNPTYLQTVSKFLKSTDQT